MFDNEFFKHISEIALDLGAYKASVVDVESIETDVAFRELCATNVCGNYGRNWKCPPDAGDINLLISELRTYPYALVYQTVSTLEDSYDFEGMMEAGDRHNKLMSELREKLKDEPLSRKLHLGAGGCRMCKVCTKITNEPCRHPDLAIASLETYGINVSKLAQLAEMKYINGKDTVTYFGAVLFEI